MNDMEQKIKERSAQRQSKLTKKEKEDIAMLAKKLATEAEQTRKKELAEGKGNGKVKKSKIVGEGASAKQSTKNGEKTPKFTKKTAGAKTSKAPAQPAKKPTNVKPTGDILTTKEVAAMVGTTPKALRRVLRAKWYNDNVTTNYAWTKSDPILKEIVAHYAALAKKAK